MKIHKQTKDGTTTVTIPKAYMEILEWNAGDDLCTKLDIENKAVIFKKKETKNEIPHQSK